MDKNRLVIGVATVLLVLPLAGCGDSDEEKLEKQIAELEAELAEKKANAGADFAGQLTEAIGKVTDGVETMSARDLKAMLPESIDGMQRTSFSASKQGIQGLGVSVAEATYEQDDDDGLVELSLTDIGGMSGFAAMGLDVLDVEIDEENQDGWQRTDTYKGFKSFQSFSNTGSGSESEMVVFVGERFLLRIDGENVDWKIIEELAEEVPVQKLAAMD